VKVSLDTFNDCAHLVKGFYFSLQIMLLAFCERRNILLFLLEMISISANHPRVVSSLGRVGWEEHSETRRTPNRVMGFTTLSPSYGSLLRPQATSYGL
jgi:hypothetical protein